MKRIRIIPLMIMISCIGMCMVACGDNKKNPVDWESTEEDYEANAILNENSLYGIQPKHEMSGLKEFSTTYVPISARNGYLIVADGEDEPRNYGLMDGEGKLVLPVEYRNIEFVENVNLDIVRACKIENAELDQYYFCFYDFDGREIVRSYYSLDDFYEDEYLTIVYEDEKRILIDSMGNRLKEYEPPEDSDDYRRYNSIVGDKYLVQSVGSTYGRKRFDDAIDKVAGIYDLDENPIWCPDDQDTRARLIYMPSGYFLIRIEEENFWRVLDENGNELMQFNNVYDLKKLDDTSLILTEHIEEEDGSDSYIKAVLNLSTGEISDYCFDKIDKMYDGKAFAETLEYELVVIDNQGNILSRIENGDILGYGMATIKIESDEFEEGFGLNIIDLNQNRLLDELATDCYCFKSNDIYRNHMSSGGVAWGYENQDEEKVIINRAGESIYTFDEPALDSNGNGHLGWSDDGTNIFVIKITGGETEEAGEATAATYYIEGVPLP